MELKRYLAIIWRWAWLIVLGSVIAGGAVYFVSINTTPVYRASTRLLIDEAPGSASGNEYSQILLEQRLTQTYIEIMRTRPILEETVRRLELPLSPGALAGKITVSAPQDTQIIVISVEDTDPYRAADIANMVGAVFIDQNQARENLRYAEPIANWQERQQEIADEIETLEAEINAFDDGESAESQATLSRLQTQLNEAQIRYTEAFNNLNDLQVALAKESSNVLEIEAAQPITSPIRPRTFSNTLMATVAGGMLAIAAAFLIEYLDDTLKTPEQVAEAADLSTLGAIAHINGENPDELLVTVQTPRSPISEAYRVLRTNLGFSSVDGDLESVLVTSASPGEGKSTTAANLAIVLSQTGKRVIVVDADLRRPSLHKFFKLSNNQGLTTAVFDSQTPLKQHIQPTKVPGLRVLTSGPLPPNPAELLNSQRMGQVLEGLKEEAQLIVFDTPPTLTVADASILSPLVSGCLLVVEVGKTRRDTFMQAVERLHKANANLFGVVMNLLKPSRSGYYYYYYYDYYYSPYYSQDDRPSRKRRQRQSGLPAWLSSLGRR